MALSPLLFNFVLEFVIRKIQQYREGLIFSAPNKIVAYVDDVDLLADITKEGLQVNVCKTKYLVTAETV